MPAITIILICYNRKNELKDCIQSVLKQSFTPYEIIVVDNNSTDGTDTLFYNDEIAHPSIKYFKLGKNLGVAGGRNYGIRQASGDILVFIDDDALLEPEDAMEKIVNRFEKDSSTGILAFKVINYYTKAIQRNEFPHIDKSLNPDKEFETSYFIGAGHAIRKEVFDKCGLYPEDYFYGMEELDLSFRAIDKGFKIIYFPNVVVLHKKSLMGRISDKKKYIYNYRNRLGISYKYLRNRHFALSAFIWFFKIVKESSSFLTPIKGITSFLAYKKSLLREPISDLTLQKIRKLKGRIWY
jgi:GT2 family glycosyltransferase